MRTYIIIAVSTLWVAASPVALASDQNFYEVARACRATAEAHTFRIRFSTDRQPRFVFTEDTLLTKCLAQGASPNDEEGNPRRYSLGAYLKRAVAECGAKFGSAGDFNADFSPEPQGHFSVRIGPESNKARACIAVLTALIQPFGAKQ